MSTRNKILLGALVLTVASIVFQYLLPTPLLIDPPHVSVAAEPVFYIGAEGVGMGHGHEGDFIINNSMIMAVIVVLFLIIFSWFTTRNMQLIPRGLQNFMEMVVDGLYNTFGAVDRRYIARFWPMVGTIFFYVLLSNWLALLPGVLSIGYYEGHNGEARIVPNLLAWTSSEVVSDVAAAPVAAEEGKPLLIPFLRSPSADLNNTFMLALVAVGFVQFWGIRELGGTYFTKFLPLGEFKRGIAAGLLGLFVGLVELISEIARIISFAFRLFGNIFAGEVILLVMAFLLPVLQLPFMGLELFIGFIQAFVFAILTMVFASLATQAHGDHGHEGTHGAYAEEVPGDLGGATRANPAH